MYIPFESLKFWYASVAFYPSDQLIDTTTCDCNRNLIMHWPSNHPQFQPQQIHMHKIYSLALSISISTCMSMTDDTYECIVQETGSGQFECAYPSELCVVRVNDKCRERCISNALQMSWMNARGLKRRLKLLLRLWFMMCWIVR